MSIATEDSEELTLAIDTDSYSGNSDPRVPASPSRTTWSSEKL